MITPVESGVPLPSLSLASLVASSYYFRPRLYCPCPRHWPWGMPRGWPGSDGRNWRPGGIWLWLRGHKPMSSGWIWSPPDTRRPDPLCLGTCTFDRPACRQTPYKKHQTYSFPVGNSRTRVQTLCCTEFATYLTIGFHIGIISWRSTWKMVRRLFRFGQIRLFWPFEKNLKTQGKY